MALAKRKPAALRGHASPRLSPPVPARSAFSEYVSQAQELGITLFPWQVMALRYICGLGPDDRWLYGEAATIVSRQNGKTELLLPIIVRRLRDGRRLMHTAQNRELPREVFGRVADAMETLYSAELRSRPRFANGQEEIRTRNGGSYRIVAPTRGGARGPSNDDVIADELREMVSFEFIGAAKPTLTASHNPQVLYLSNMGTDESVVLNALKLRSGSDPRLAYLEWSAAPDRDAGDRRGWEEANPRLGHDAELETYLENEYRSSMLGQTLSIFETEHLCRHVASLHDPILTAAIWNDCQGAVEEPRRPMMGIAVDPSGTRASAVIAWRQADGMFGLRLVAEVTGDPIDMDLLGTDMLTLANKLGVAKTGQDPETDGELAKYLRNVVPIIGVKFTNATSTFVNLATARRLRWDDAPSIGADLAWTAKKVDVEDGTFRAVKASEGHPITAALAAIRAVGLASGPQLSGVGVF